MSGAAPEWLRPGRKVWIAPFGGLVRDARFPTEVRATRVVSGRLIVEVRRPEGLDPSIAGSGPWIWCDATALAPRFETVVAGSFPLEAVESRLEREILKIARAEGIDPEAPAESRREALESVRPHVAGLRARVLEHVRTQGERGSTCDEIEAALGLSHQTASARVHELARSGRLEPRGRRETRSGRRATVWAACEVSGSSTLGDSPADRRRAEIERLRAEVRALETILVADGWVRTGATWIKSRRRSRIDSAIGDLFAAEAGS